MLREIAPDVPEGPRDEDGRVDVHLRVAQGLEEDVYGGVLLEVMLPQIVLVAAELLGGGVDRAVVVLKLRADEGRGRLGDQRRREGEVVAEEMGL